MENPTDARIRKAPDSGFLTRNTGWCAIHGLKFQCVIVSFCLQTDFSTIFSNLMLTDHWSRSVTVAPSRPTLAVALAVLPRALAVSA